MDHDHHPKTDVHTEEAVVHDVAAPGPTFVAFFFIVTLAALALFVGFSDGLGPWKLTANLAIACVQAGILAFYLMDLRQADKVTWLIAASGVFWTSLFFLFTLTDYLTRYLGVL